MDDLASFILAALDEQRQIEPISDRIADFDLDTAYSVSEAIIAARIARGEVPVGWKIGFTNRTIWDEYDVHAPIWGPIYDTTLRGTGAAATAELDAADFIEPRIEPGIVFRIAHTPRASMDDHELISCIDAVGHGFEIVQSPFPGWRFRAADTIAACALHGALLHGPLTAISTADAGGWIERMKAFRLTLLRNGEAVETGDAANVLGGPLAALRHFAAGLEARPLGPGIRAGDIVTTGTITRAFPIYAGETWSTLLDGIPLPGFTLQCNDEAGRLDRLIARAAGARFHMETPESCQSPSDYQRAVAESVRAEAAISRLLFRDPAKLDMARAEIGRQALTLSTRWRNTRAP